MNSYLVMMKETSLFILNDMNKCFNIRIFFLLYVPVISVLHLV